MICTLCDNEALEANVGGRFRQAKKDIFVKISKSVIKNVRLGKNFFVHVLWDLQVMLGIRGIIARAPTVYM